jgi:hypothetical protein
MYIRHPLHMLPCITDRLHNRHPILVLRTLVHIPCNLLFLQLLQYLHIQVSSNQQALILRDLLRPRYLPLIHRMYIRHPLHMLPCITDRLHNRHPILVLRTLVHIPCNLLFLQLLQHLHIQVIQFIPFLYNYSDPTNENCSIASF